MSIPHLFRCPISLDLFTEPVTLTTGQTYDRPSIEKWLGDGHRTCPVTMQRLDDTSWVPNRTLRQLIDQWLLSVRELNRLAQVSGSGTEFSLTTLKQNLQSKETGIATKIEILKKVRIISVESDTGQACLVQLGYFSLLLQMVFKNPSFINWELVELALDCVVSLSPDTQLDSLKNELNVPSFLLLLELGNAKIKTSLCYLLETISTEAETRELCVSLAQSRHVFQVLASVFNTRIDEKSSEAAVRAISGICALEANRKNAIRGGAIDGLIIYLQNSSPRNSTMALATLETLVGSNESGKRVLMKNSNAVRVLVKYVFRISPLENKASEHAIGLLSVLCGDSSKARAEAVNAGVLTELLLLLQSQCGTKAKAKARTLLKLLRALWVRDPCFGSKFYNAV